MTELEKNFWIAVKNEEFDTIEKYIKAGVNINIQEEERDGTALMYACCNGSVSIAELLIVNGAELNIQSKHKMTALMYSTGSQCLDSVKLLLKAKADVNIQDNTGVTALMHTSLVYKNGDDQIEVIKLLIENDANIDLQDDDGRTYLMQSCGINKRELQIEAVKLLLEKGANVDIKDKYGKTALDIAKDNLTELYAHDRKLKKECKELIELLQKHQLEKLISKFENNSFSV